MWVSNVMGTVSYVKTGIMGSSKPKLVFDKL